MTAETTEPAAGSTERIHALLAEDSRAELAALFNALPPSDALRELSNLSAEQRDSVLVVLPPASAAELIDEAPNELAAELIERLDAAQAAPIIEALDSDVQADVIGELSQADADAILANMEPSEAADVRRLAEYATDTAGGLMVAETFTFAETDTVGSVLRRIVSDDEDFERCRGHHPYVVNDVGQPVGVVSLRALLTSRRNAPLTEVMTTPLTVLVNLAIDDLQDLFGKHDFLGLPVIELDGRLVGVVSRGAVDEAALGRATADNLKQQGVIGDEVRSMPMKLRARRRLAWLSANIVLNIMAASVISAYEETLAAVIAIAVFLPMVSDMSGCSGNQAVAVTMRELALGLARPSDALRIWRKEVIVGLINGVALGTLIGLVAWAWKGNAYLGLVIGVALAVNTLIAVSIGGVIPLALKRFGQDPAVASGPLLTTITDMAGFFLVLSLATILLPKL
jgi:magnesium transporter